MKNTIFIPLLSIYSITLINTPIAKASDYITTFKTFMIADLTAGRVCRAVLSKEVNSREEAITKGLAYVSGEDHFKHILYLQSEYGGEHPLVKYYRDNLREMIDEDCGKEFTSLP